MAALSNTGETNVSRFLKAFDSKNEKHVKWLAHMTDISEDMNDPKKSITLNAEINLNPMKINLNHNDTLDWIHIHFVLCASYAKNVLNGTAWTPPKN
jgi:hypothetical protein